MWWIVVIWTNPVWPLSSRAASIARWFILNGCRVGFSFIASCGWELMGQCHVVAVTSELKVDGISPCVQWLTCNVFWLHCGHASSFSRSFSLSVWSITKWPSDSAVEAVSELLCREDSKTIFWRLDQSETLEPKPPTGAETVKADNYKMHLHL